MPKQYLYVLTDAAQGFDREFNEWYDRQHIPEVLEIPGFVAATRFRQLSDIGLPDTSAQIENEYLATYEISGDPRRAIEGLLERRSNGTIQLPPYIANARRLGVFIEQES